MLNFSKIVQHHSVTKQYQELDEAVRNINYMHKQRLHPFKNGFGYNIAYHYIVAYDGSFRATRPLNEIGYHCGVWSVNANSIGICCLGNFENDTPTKEQYETIAKIIKQVEKEKGKKEYLRHRGIKATACPGNNFNINIVKELMENPELKMSESKYTDIFLDEVKEPIFNSHEGDDLLSEKQIKELIEIAINRFGQVLFDSFSEKLGNEESYNILLKGIEEYKLNKKV